MGNLLEIGVAAYIDGPYYNLLFSERLYLGFYAERNILRLARAFAATRRVLADLKVFYRTLPQVPPNIEHLFPSPRPVPTYTDSMPSLTFTHRLSRSGDTVVLAEDQATRQSGIYLANMARPLSADGNTVMSSSVDPATSKVVVKFTVQYHLEAHRLLANMGLAPALHACVPVCGGLIMVVMDFVPGETAFKISEHEPEEGKLPYAVYEDIETAITALHSQNLVFCDLRTPNIMVVPGGSDPGSRPRGMLIDFDYVGIHGIGRYPASLDDDLPEFRSSGIRRYEIMNKAHDLVMLERFKDRCLSV
jgi:serine/threonine protein kinase